MLEQLFNFSTPLDDPIKMDIEVTIEGVGTMGCQGMCLGDCVAAMLVFSQQIPMTSADVEGKYELVSYDPNLKKLVARKKQPRQA